MDSPGGELSMGAGMAIPGRPAEGDDAPQVFHNFVGPRFFGDDGDTGNGGTRFRRHRRRACGQARRHQCRCGATLLRGSRSDRPAGLVGDPGCRRCPPPSLASIIGVVKDVRYASLRADAPLMIYRPYREQPGAPADTFLIRTSSADADALAPLLRAELRQAAPALPPPSVVTLADTVAAVLVEERMLAALSTAIGALAAMLAAIGIYSIVAATVRRRQRGDRHPDGARRAPASRGRDGGQRSCWRLSLPGWPLECPRRSPPRSPLAPSSPACCSGCRRRIR